MRHDSIRTGQPVGTSVGTNGPASRSGKLVQLPRSPAVVTDRPRSSRRGWARLLVLRLRKASAEPRKHGVPTPDDAPELGEPAPSAKTADEFSLVGQQFAFYRALAEQDERVAGWHRRVPVGRDAGPLHRAVGADGPHLPGPAGGRGHHLAVRPGHRRGPDQASRPPPAGLGPEPQLGPR